MHAGARCFYRVEDWWTYELCYQKHVRQFHREKDVLTAEYMLGVYHQDSAETDTLQVTLRLDTYVERYNLLTCTCSGVHLFAAQTKV